MLPISTIARVAAEVRLQLSPRLAVTDRLTFGRLRTGVRLTGLGPELLTVARPHVGLSLTTYATSEFDVALGEAWVWLNREAWPEFVAGDVPRSVATVAHELGHVALHAEEVDELRELDAETDHDRRMDLRGAPPHPGSGALEAAATDCRAAREALRCLGDDGRQAAGGVQKQ